MQLLTRKLNRKINTLIEGQTNTILNQKNHIFILLILCTNTKLLNAYRKESVRLF